VDELIFVYALNCWFPLQADDFRGHGLSLRVLRTTGSQGSWDCTIVRPTEDLLLFPQDKESCDSVTSHEENWSVFSRSRRLPFQLTVCASNNERRYIL